MLDKLNPRERIMVLVLVGVGLVAGLYFVGKKIGDMRAKITKRVAAARKNARKIERIRDTISRLPRAKALDTKLQLMTKASQLAREHDLKSSDIRDRVEKTRRVERVRVEMTFNSVPLAKIMKFIHSVEQEKRINARIGSLVFRRSLPSKEVYDVSLSLMIEKPRERKRKPPRRRRRSSR